MTQTVYRDGDRIRATDGTGYVDHVSDEQILEHIRNHQRQAEIDGHYDGRFEPFARAVLAIREYERAAS